ncbi:MAG: Rne/Rng family ribonuclease [Burkholderiales bacterium]|nr:Rne/Rng family ribonuclease [Burkholderiales bacterium]
MTEDILVNVSPFEVRVALVQQGAVQEFHLERAASRGLVGNICLGRVARVLPGMQSAFIDIGLDRAAFLHVADLWQSRGAGTTPPIEKLLYESQPLLVQVIKDPIGTKGARLSTQISIAGRLLVYLPQDPHIGVSQRIGNEAERSALRERIQRLMPEEEQGGVIIRTMAEDAPDEQLSADIDYLRKRWRQILEASKSQTAPALLYQELSLTQRVLRDIAGEHTTGIIVDSQQALEELQAFAGTYMPSVLSKLRRHAGDRPLFDLHRVEEELERALARRVDLKSGGYLIIDQTEAMTTIDVNTGGFVGGRNFDDTVFRTNLEAAHAIARQLRVRNLGGIVIIDFIDMTSTEHRDAVQAELRRVVEVTRKRTRESLAHVLCEPCATCAGKGEIRTARTVAYGIMREIQREARQFNPREFRILAAQSVIDLFLEEESQHLAALGDAIGKPISLQVENLYSQEQYDIVLI